MYCVNTYHPLIELNILEAIQTLAFSNGFFLGLSQINFMEKNSTSSFFPQSSKELE